MLNYFLQIYQKDIFRNRNKSTLLGTWPRKTMTENPAPKEPEDEPIQWIEHELKVIEEAKRRSKRFICVGENERGGGIWMERDPIEERAKI